MVYVGTAQKDNIANGKINMKWWGFFLGISWIVFDAQANEALGRLFFTPEQRHTLDQVRIDSHRQGPALVSGPPPSPPPPPRPHQ